MNARLISQSSAAYKRKFIHEVFVTVGVAFFIYLVVVYYLSLNSFTEPLIDVFFINVNQAIASFVVYNILCIIIYLLFDSNHQDSVKIFGFVFIIIVRALYFSPLLIALANEYPEILKTAFFDFLSMIGVIFTLKDQAIKSDFKVDLLKPILQIVSIFLLVNALWWMKFGFNVGLLYVFIATLLYSAALLSFMVQILKADDGIGSFKEGEVLSASFYMFSLLESLYFCLVVLIIFIKLVGDR